MKNRELIALFLFITLKISAQKTVLDTIPYALEYHQQRLDIFKKEAAITGKLVFLGDSQIEFGNWQKHLADTTIINRGIAGDNTYGVLARLNEVIDKKPQLVIIEVGINDIAKNIPDKIIAQNIAQIVMKIKKGNPKIKVFLTSILPTNDAVKKEYPAVFGKNNHIYSINRDLQAYRSGL
jgi:GDSL-like Lipase/Acylhydrolase family